MLISCFQWCYFQDIVTFKLMCGCCRERAVRSNQSKERKLYNYVRQDKLRQGRVTQKRERRDKSEKDRTRKMRARKDQGWSMARWCWDEADILSWSACHNWKRKTFIWFTMIKCRVWNSNWQKIQDAQNTKHICFAPHICSPTLLITKFYYFKMLVNCVYNVLRSLEV